MVTTHQLTNQRVKAIRKVVLEDSNTMKDILDPSSVGFRPHHGLLLSISYATKFSVIRVRAKAVRPSVLLWHGQSRIWRMILREILHPLLSSTVS